MRVRSVIDAAARWDRWHAGPDIEDPMSVEEFPEWILGYDRGDFIERAGWRLCPVTCWSLPIDGSRSRSAGGGRRMPVSVLPIWST
jgi:hypothetical protein